MTQQYTVTTVTEDYLKALWSAETRGKGMTISQLAKKMGVVASTASENVTRLKAQGLVEHQPYRPVHLSDTGRHVAVGIIRRHRLLETYLHEHLGFEWDEVHEEAETLEHAVSDRLLAKLDHILGYPARDPHGDPIPSEDGTWHAPTTQPLAHAPSGQGLLVGRISDQSSQILRDLEKLGIALDMRLTIRTIHPNGSMQIEVSTPDNTQTQTLTLNAQHVAAIEIIDQSHEPIS